MKSPGERVFAARSSIRTRHRRLFATLTVTALAAGSLATGAAAAAAAAATTHHHHAARSGPQGDEGTMSQDLLRTGWDPNEPALTPAAVSGGSFGQIFSTAVNGQVYAQPLVIGNTLIVATENDWMYGLNATTGAILWSTSLGTPYNITTCNDLTPNIGVTSTPVYDPSTGTVYAMGLVHEISWEWHLFGLNVNTGAITYKQRIVGHPTNDSQLTFSPLPQDQRPGLLLMNGWVYASFASHCDHDSYDGYVAGFKVASPGTTTLWADDVGVSNKKGGIWQSGGGMMSDGPGRIFISSGNGISPAKGPGNKPPAQLAESVIRLQPQSNGSLQAQDFFSPSNAPSLDSSDTDLGSGGPTGLPFGTNTYPHILMQAGKDGNIFLLNRDNLGGRGSSNNDLAEVGPYQSQFGHPGIFADTNPLTAANAGSANDYMIYVGKDDFMREFKFGVNGSDKPTLSDLSNSSFTLGYTSGPPVITSNGTNASTGLIWEVHSTDKTGTGAYLGAWGLLPVPRSGGGTKLSEIFAAPIGTSSQFPNIATANGMVYVGTRDGHVLGFGIKGAALKRSGTAQFRDTPVGSSSTRHVTLTAASTATVTGASVSAGSTVVPFTLGKVTVTRHGGGTAAVKFPVTLHKGDVLRAAVKYAPTATGGSEGTVSFTTSGGTSPPVSVPLIGDGTTTGLAATNPAMTFHLIENDGMVITNVPVGISAMQVTDIVNTGTKPVRVTSVTPPSGTYHAIGLPRPGTVLQPGESVPVQVIYSPQHSVTNNGSFSVKASRGTSVTVTLTGTGLAPVSKFTATPGVVHFGSVPVGQTATRQVTVVNAGNQPSLIGRTSLSGAPFGAPLKAAAGLPVNQGYDLVLPVTFHPTKAGAYHGIYKLTWTDRFGTHTLNVPITGTGV